MTSVSSPFLDLGSASSKGSSTGSGILGSSNEERFRRDRGVGVGRDVRRSEEVEERRDRGRSMSREGVELELNERRRERSGLPFEQGIA